MIAWIAAAALCVGASGEPGAGAGGTRGERAIRSSLYLDMVPAVVGVVGEELPEILDGLALEPARRGAVSRALEETWTERRISAHAAAALERAVPAAVLDAAIAQRTPEILASIRAGIGDGGTPEEIQAWVAAARRHPEAAEREALATRIAAQLPRSGAMRRILAEVAELMADVAQAATGKDELRAELREAILDEATLAAMDLKSARIAATVAVYRDEPTARLRALAAALESEGGRTLERATVDALAAGLAQARREVQGRLARDLAALGRR